MIQADTVIIGAGLAGLAVARSLQQQGEDYCLLEARPRLGGRVYTEHYEGADCDLGAAWFWPQINPRIKTLAEQLGLGIFPQHQRGGMIFQSPTGFIHRQAHSWAQSPQPMRFRGGTSALIRALTAGLDGQRLRLSTRVSQLRCEEGRVTLHLEDQQAPEQPARQSSLTARRVVLALPPRLLASQIQFEPQLPAAVMSRLRQTDTWMATHAKAVAVYSQAFWRSRRQSGLAISQCGPLAEIHDASPVTGELGALFGFFAWPAHERVRQAESLKQQVKEQLAALFGAEAGEPQYLTIHDWSQERDTATPVDLQGQPQHPEGGAPDLSGTVWASQLFFAGSETASGENAGYLEGALEAAERCLTQLERCRADAAMT